ncbi:MAG: hypothetical protein MZW92_37245 [Comamonadaceae bacterium]|nr:hypothetical protein [Comamonadaceae bacterium]
MVVLSKADLLAFDDRWKMFGHVLRELTTRIGAEVPVYLMSTRPGEVALFDDWIRRGFDPCVRKREKLKEVSLRCKLGALREGVFAALERRLSLATRHLSREAWDEAEAALSQAQALLDTAVRQVFDPRREADRQAAGLVDEVAHNAAVLWNQTHESRFDVTTLLTASLEARAAGVARTVAKSLLKLRAQLSNALASATADVACSCADVASLPKPRAMPLFDGAACITPTVLAKPAFAFSGAGGFIGPRTVS